MTDELAWFAGRLFIGLRDRTSDLGALDSSGIWIVVADFEKPPACLRFNGVRSARLPRAVWAGIPRTAWVTSMDRDQYVTACSQVRELIAAGEVYQVNVCRVLSAPAGSGTDVLGLANLLSRGNPAPYAGVVRCGDLQVATASPELFLRRQGSVIESSPIKGTGRTPTDLLPKDRAENVMIVDLVRNDLSRVCETGSVSVPDLCVVEKHPGLVHLVSTVRGSLLPGTTWPEIFDAIFPPGSVTGAPKSSALKAIRDLEPVPRGPYCGAIGWVDADRRTARLAVGIRSFWLREGRLYFGTGAGITWGSDPELEWDETELKADRLLAVASGAGE